MLSERKTQPINSIFVVGSAQIEIRPIVHCSVRDRVASFFTGLSRDVACLHVKNVEVK